MLIGRFRLYLKLKRFLIKKANNKLTKNQLVIYKYVIKKREIYIGRDRARKREREEIDLSIYYFF